MGDSSTKGVFSTLYAFVDGVTLIPQDKSNACWYASTKMMQDWRDRKTKTSNAADILSHPNVQQGYKNNELIPWSGIRTFGEAAGMRVAPLMTPTPATLAGWLRKFGPLWTDGIAVDWKGNKAGPGHVVVLAGVRSVPNSDNFEVYVYDPWPVGQGHEGWRPISHLVSIMKAGADPARNVTFMHYP